LFAFRKIPQSLLTSIADSFKVDRFLHARVWNDFKNVAVYAFLFTSNSIVIDRDICFALRSMFVIQV
jgi:Na+-transporting NADH:ubiquinone oxidoreductase subunit NqrD